MTSRLGKLGVVALVALPLALQAERSADACGYAIEVRTDPLAQAVSTAERASAGGDQRAAVGKLLSVAPDLWSKKAGSSYVGDRALRVAARAIVRSNGDVSPSEVIRTKTKATNASDRPDHGVEWASKLLEGFAAKTKGEPETMTDLAEALERLPGRRSEAKALLGSLEKQDLMTSAFGYAALARIRANPAPEAPSFIAVPLATFEHGALLVDLARCRSLTKSSTICREPKNAKSGD